MVAATAAAAAQAMRVRVLVSTVVSFTDAGLVLIGGCGLAAGLGGLFSVGRGLSSGDVGEPGSLAALGRTVGTGALVIRCVRSIATVNELVSRGVTDRTEQPTECEGSGLLGCWRPGSCASLQRAYGRLGAASDPAGAHSRTDYGDGGSAQPADGAAPKRFLDRNDVSVAVGEVPVVKGAVGVAEL